MTATIIRGNALALPLADESVDLICTSPPYFGLRSYQDKVECARCRQYREDGRNLTQAWPNYPQHVEDEHKPSHYPGQIGSEATPTEFLDALIAATTEMVRVLKPSGSIFLNLGDKYAGGGGQWDKDERPDPQKRRAASGSIGTGGKTYGFRPKSLMLIPERYRIRCVDELGLIARAVIIWDKVNPLPESVTDRVRRSHEDWVHLTKRPRYYSAIDEIREGYGDRHGGGRSLAAQFAVVGGSQSGLDNPLGKLPGSVWTIATEPLTVPEHLGVDHFAAYPTEWPRRIIAGWSPREVCTACGEGRRPVSVTDEPDRHEWAQAQQRTRTALSGGVGKVNLGVPASDRNRRITGYACACPDTTAPATPGVVLDPFGGTGTTALVATALGRHGISIDMSADYCRLATWRTTDPKQLAKAARKPFEPPREQVSGQDAFEFEEESA